MEVYTHVCMCGARVNARKSLLCMGAGGWMWAGMRGCGSNSRLATLVLCFHEGLSSHLPTASFLPDMASMFTLRPTGSSSDHKP